MAFMRPFPVVMAIRTYWCFTLRMLEDVRFAELSKAAGGLKGRGNQG